MRVEQLGAHLEAYIATLPMIITLRLCNRFGTGDDCHVNRLPIELVKLIEEYIVGPERKMALLTWSQQKKCNEKKCKVFDHYSATKEELFQRYHELIGSCRCEEKGTCGVNHHRACGHRLCADAKAELPGRGFEVFRKLSSLGILPAWSELCQSQQEEWQKRVGTIEKGGSYSPREHFEDGFFDKQQEILQTHFGIIVWLGHSSAPYLNRHTGDCTSSYTTTAHLALPGTTIYRKVWCSNKQSRAKSFDMPFTLGSVPTEKSLLRLPRALKILGLQSGLQDDQVAQTRLSSLSIDATASETNEETVLQPQLTLLMRTTTGCENNHSFGCPRYC